MKKGILLLLLCGLSSIIGAQDDKVLMTIGDTPVYLSEFTYIYEKNNGASADYSEASVEEYLNLFTNFKLKVQKARAMQLDTITALQEELAGYRKQLANSYLMDRELSERLIKEMWDRRQEDVHIAHILIKLRKNPSNEEIEAAKAKASSIKAMINDQKTFEAVAAEMSEDLESKNNGGSLGFITAWLPTGFYELENAAYELKPGHVSDPIVTKLGVHLVKVLDKRPAYGKIEVAHILMRKSNNNITDDPKDKIIRMKELLDQGNDFEALAKQYSEDASSSMQGGKLQPFGINTFEQDFENAAFSLEKDGDISDEVETRIGWHIIKRISKPEESFDDFKKRIKPLLAKMDRYEYIKDKLIEEIKEETHHTVNKKILNGFIAQADSSFLTYKWNVPTDISNEELMNFGPEFSYSLKDFAVYCKRNARMRMRFNREKLPNEAVRSIFDSYVNEKAMLYEEKNLENKYPDFKALMREYEEGILLFEVSKMEVWDKASQDTVGLKKFYDRNKEKYFAPLKAEIATYSIEPKYKSKINEIYQHAREYAPQETLDNFNNKYTVVSIELKTRTSNTEDMMVMDEGWISGMEKDMENGNTTFTKVIKVLPKEYKTLDESKGYVIADYQLYLEEQWIEALKEEFKVKYKKKVVNSLVK